MDDKHELKIKIASVLLDEFTKQEENSDWPHGRCLTLTYALLDKFDIKEKEDGK